jgi:hypothetical protein
MQWHVLHMMSFNYPVHPTHAQKQQYRSYVMQLQYVLPCRHCRDNIRKNMRKKPLTWAHMKNRATFSRYMYELHELVNTMLHKKSGLSYADVRERYEHFRSRCTVDGKEVAVATPIDTNANETTLKTESKTTNEKENKKENKTRSHSKTEKKRKKKELGCTEPMYGKKSKCVITIVPQSHKTDTFQVNKNCFKSRHAKSHTRKRGFKSRD